MESSKASSMLVLLFSGDPTRKFQRLYSVSEEKSYAKCIPEMENNICWATAQGWLLTMDPLTLSTLLWNPTSLEKLELPPMEQDTANLCHTCVLSLQPTDPNCLVLMTEDDNSAFWFCRRGDDKWVRHEYVIEENRVIYSIVARNGEFYGLTMSEKIINIKFSPDPSFTILSNIQSHQWPAAKFVCTSYLVQSCGELFRVCIYRPFFFKKIGDVAVHRMDFINKRWVQVYDIDDHVFFLDASGGLRATFYGSSRSAREVGVKGNCIYFVRDDQYLHIYDIQEGTLALQDPCTDHEESWPIESLRIMPAPSLELDSAHSS